MPMLERRLANDGHPYTYADFLQHYGDVAHSFWLAALPALVEPTLEQPYRQHFSRAAQQGDQRAQPANDDDDGATQPVPASPTASLSLRAGAHSFRNARTYVND